MAVRMMVSLGCGGATGAGVGDERDGREMRLAAAAMSLRSFTSRCSEKSAWLRNSKGAPLLSFRTFVYQLYWNAFLPLNVRGLVLPGSGRVGWTEMAYCRDELGTADTARDEQRWRNALSIFSSAVTPTV